MSGSTNGNRSLPTRVALGIAGYGGFLAVNVLFVALSPLLQVGARLSGPGGTRRLRAVFTRLLRFLTFTYLPALRVYRVEEVAGRERIQSLPPAVYVANHRSRLDALLLLALVPRSTAVIKSRYARLPLFSRLVSLFDFVPVQTTGLRPLGEAFDKCTQLIREGYAVIVFPEGTRSRSGRLRRFGDFAFRLAAAANAPLVPVVIHTGLPFMAKRPGSLVPSRRFPLRIRFLSPRHDPHDPAKSLSAERVRRDIAGELAKLDIGTPWDTSPERPVS